MAGIHAARMIRLMHPIHTLSPHVRGATCRPQRPSKFREELFIMERKISCSVAQG